MAPAFRAKSIQQLEPFLISPQIFYPEITIIEPFDLLEFQKKARETCCPKKLFELWEDVSRRYDRHQIGEYEYEEMKEAIWPNLHALDSLRRSINETEEPSRNQQRKLA